MTSLPTDLTTEGVDPRFADLDTKSVAELAAIMNDNDKDVALAVGRALPQVVVAIEAIAARFTAGGRIIYVGAGTSGRLGVLDASECPPTFNTDPDRVVGLIAGGEEALRNPIEGAEDDAGRGARDLEALGLVAADAVVGIASSGRTPYVMGAVQRAREVGALTVAVVCNVGSVLGEAVDHPIEVVVGPEFVAGSTRLKSGTAQKLVLNMVSTITMVRAGKVFGNRMVDVRATNEKLQVRAARMVAELADVSEGEARVALEANAWSVKHAVVALVRGVSAQVAWSLLEDADGRLREALAT